MSVSIAKIVEQADDFEAKQLKAFKVFINTSKALKAAIKTQDQKAQKNYDELQALLQSLQESVQANGESPISILEQDIDYTQALKMVDILPDDLNKPEVSIQYIDTFLERVEKEMKQRESESE